MPESVVLSLTGDSDDAIDLYAWLSGDRELPGRVRLAPAAAPEGALGAGLMHLLVTLESGGMATAFASVLIAWIRRRAGSITVKVTPPGGATFELKAERVRELKAEDLQKLAAQLATTAWPADAAVTPPGEDRAAGTA